MRIRISWYNGAVEAIAVRAGASIRVERVE